MTIKETLNGARKALAAGVAAGLGTLGVAIQETVVDGKIVEPAFHITVGEWSTVLSTTLLAIGAVYQIANKVKPADTDEPDSALKEVHVEPIDGAPA